jgi:hypothetical protein
MAYVFDLEREDDFEIFIDADGSRIVDFALGYDLDSSLVILMSVMLIPDESGAFELCFGIRKRNVENALEVSPPDYRSETAKQFVPRTETENVRSAILSTIEALVKAVKPEDIIMETFHANLPPRAMKKYDLICEILAKNFYRLTDQFRDGTDGKDYWSFSRKD